jgi:hypothetical protein
MIATKFCECGCRSRIPRRDNRGRPRSYAEGHSNKGKNNPWLAVDRPSRPSGYRHRDAKKLRKVTRCALRRIGGCKGLLEVHHKDGDHTNGARRNLAKVCRAHHRLLHNGRITMRSTKMPPFRVRNDGKRIYA